MNDEVVVCSKCMREVEHLGPGIMACRNNHGLLDITQVKLHVPLAVQVAKLKQNSLLTAQI